jgi:arylsulfatase A-like enzyme
MNRRIFLKIAGSSIAASQLSGFGCSKTKADNPNVLFIAIDDLNDWIGCLNGHPNTKTPNLDRLAKQSTLFTNAHCQAPICGPSRASLMTGLYPSTTGIYGQINDNNIRESNAKTQKAFFLTEYLRNNGYKTMAVGKLFHKHVPKGTVDISGGRVNGFGPKPPTRLQWDRKGTSTDWGAFPGKDEEMPDFGSARWAADRLNENHEKPFFLGVGFLRPHVPWHVPQKWFDLHPIEQIENPPYLADDYDDLPEIAIKLADVPMMPTTEWAIKNKKWKYIVQAYLACVSFVDAQVGKVLDALENSQYKDNTLIVLWSDHGYHIGEKNRFAKHSIWERATRTVLMIKDNKAVPNQKCSKPVGLVDLYPTILDLCGLAPNQKNEGHSLKTLLENPSTEWKHAAITTYGRNNHAIKNERYRYIHYEDGSEELYDHENDANEWYNVAAKPEYAHVKKEMIKYLPKTNALWSKTSKYDVNDYFTEQRMRELAE